MQPVSREVFARCREGRPVFPGFVSYVRKAMPVLVNRAGWVDASDTHDDFADSLSHDNGRTWSVPRPTLRSAGTPGGRLRYRENACFFDSERERFLTFACGALYPRGHHDPDRAWEVVEDERDPGSGTWRGGRPNGNWPRSPLLIAEVQETPFAVHRAGIAVIDDRGPAEPERVQLSNSRFCHNRLTGKLVLFLTRYGQHGAKVWKRADNCRHPIPIDRGPADAERVLPRENRGIPRGRMVYSI